MLKQSSSIQLDANSALKIIAEIGLDMTRWKSAKHLASWLGLWPGTKVSGVKVLSGRSQQVANRAAAMLRMSAVALFHSKSVHGEFTQATLSPRRTQSDHCDRT